MHNMIALGGSIVGLAGVLLTVTAGVARVSGHYHLVGFESMTLFVGGMGLTLIGSFAKLHLLSSHG